MYYNIAIWKQVIYTERIFGPDLVLHQARISNILVESSCNTLSHKTKSHFLKFGFVQEGHRCTIALSQSGKFPKSGTFLKSGTLPRLHSWNRKRFRFRKRLRFPNSGTQTCKYKLYWQYFERIVTNFVQTYDSMTFYTPRTNGISILGRLARDKKNAD
jgi:hypothetical protein